MFRVYQGLHIRDKTMEDKLIYIPEHDEQNYQLCKYVCNTQLRFDKCPYFLRQRT